jgi:hypothetical protein
MAGVMRSYRAIAVLTAAVSGLVTIAFARLPQLHLSYAWPALRLALETSGSLIALFATFLVFGRLRRRTYLNELLLACALAVLALSNLLFVTVPTVAGEAPDDLTVWAAPLARSLGAVLFVLAAFATRRELRRGGPVLALAAVATLTALGLATLFAHTLAARWAPRYTATLSPVAVSQPPLRAHPALFAFELLVAVLYGLAAIGFLNLARRRRDAFYGWLAAAGILAVVSHVNYSLFPASYAQSVLYTGDVFRFAFYVALLAGAGLYLPQPRFGRRRGPPGCDAAAPARAGASPGRTALGHQRARPAGGPGRGGGAGAGGVPDSGTVPDRPRPRHRAGCPAVTHAGRGTGPGRL